MGSLNNKITLKLSRHGVPRTDYKSKELAEDWISIFRKYGIGSYIYISNACGLYSFLVAVKEGKLLPEELEIIDIDDTIIRVDKNGTLDRYPELLNYHNDLLMKLI